MKRLLTSAGVALALTSAPVAAQAADVSRAAAPTAEASAMTGENDTLLWILGAIALGVVLFLILDDDNSDSP